MTNQTTNTGVVTIKVGVMPGKITEYIVPQGTSVNEVLDLAGLTKEGYEVRVNGTTTMENLSLTTDGMVLLAKQVKGNGTYKVGVMPGKITEYAINDGTTIAELLGLAGLESTGYEVRVNGNTVTNIEAPLTGDGMVLLAKQVKGNR